MARYLKEEIKKKDIISLGLNSDIETTVTNAPLSTVPLVQKYKSGNKLSFADGKIKVGAGVHHILISANVGFNTNLDNVLISLQPTVIGSSAGAKSKVLASNTLKTSNATYNGIGAGTVLTDVKEGDLVYIDLYITSRNGTFTFKDFGTNLTVEVVD